MTAVTFKKFGGMIPRSPPQLLPDDAAADAQNCDFSKDVLAPLKSGLSFISTSTNPVRGIYTSDGIFWYTWTNEVSAHRSPVVNDGYGRVYFTEQGTFYVTTTPTSSSGGPPASQWRAGVPAPTTAPVLTLLERTSAPVLPDYPNAAFTFVTYWTYSGVNYGVTTIASNIAMTTANGVTVLSPFRQYSFVKPATPTDAPTNSTFVVQVKLADGTKTIFTLDNYTNASAPVKSSALPGGVEMTVSFSTANNVTTVTVTFTWGVVETRAYVYTIANDWGEESAPSPASIISPTYVQDVQILTTLPSATGWRPFSATPARIYRTYGGTDYIKTTVTGASPTYIDSTHTVSSAGAVLASFDWTPCPTGVLGLVAAGNGWFACFAGNSLYMSEPYRPHAWPYSISFPKTILGICAGPQGLVVTTYDACYLVMGPHPASVSSQELNIPVGGISHRSMVKYETGVAFLSNDGIVLVEGTNASLDASQRYFTRETWRSMYGSYLSSMALGYHDGALICTDTTSAHGFIIRLDEAAGSFTRFDQQFNAMFRLPVLDTLYYSQGSTIYRFRDATPTSCSWKSKEFIFPASTRFGIGCVRTTGSSGSVSLSFFIEGQPMKYFVDGQGKPASSGPSPTYIAVTFPPITVSAADGMTYFRLPPAIFSRPYVAGTIMSGNFKWQVLITLTGDVSLDALTLAGTMGELKRA